jgi:ubiquinone/menaquinone biosynthesis C-methylase UbiE
VTVARQVRSYFDSVAPGYNGASQSPIWRIVRKREQQGLLAMAGAVAGRDILELGCGAGYYTRLLLAEGARHIWAVDFSERMLAELPSENVTAIHGDATSIDPGRSFDLIVSAGMLEFVPDPLAVLRNAARLATPGAVLVLLHPTTSLLGRAYQRFHRHNGMEIRLFSPELLDRMATDAGWRVARRGSAGPYSACARLENGA